MEIRFLVDDSEVLKKLSELTPRQFMIAWTGAVREYVRQCARERIGGRFGADIARETVQTDEINELRHVIYAGGKNGYIAEHIHTGGVIRPRNRKYLAIPIDKSVKGIYPRKYSGDLVFLRRKEDGLRGRAYLAKPMKTKVKPLWVLKKQVMQRPRPWWPTQAEAEAVTIQFFDSAF